MLYFHRYSVQEIFLSFFFGLMAHGILVPSSGMEPKHPAADNHWTSREVSPFFFKYIIKAQRGMSSYKCLFLPLNISLGYSSPSPISRSEGLNHFIAPVLSRKPRQSEWPPYSLSIPEALTTSDFIIFIYFCSFNRDIIVP